MKSLMKIFLWVAIVVVAVIIIGVVGIMLFFPKEKVKAMAVEKISTTLDRKVAIDGISVSFWGGIGAYLEGIRISNPEGFKENYFVEAKALDIKLQFWPLLKKQILVDKLILVEPKIIMRKLPDGRVNYKFGAVESAAPEAMKDMPAESKLALSAVAFDNLAIRGGICDFVDDSAGMVVYADNISLQSRLKTPEPMLFNTTGELGIDSLFVKNAALVLPTLKLRASFDATYNQKENKVSLAELNINLNGIDLQVKGDIPNLKTMNIANIDLVLEKMDIAAILALLPEKYKAKLAGYTVGGILSVNALAKYDKTAVDTLQYSGKLGLSDIKLTKQSLTGDLMIKSAEADFRNEYLKLDIKEAVFADNSFKAAISVTNFANPNVDGNLSGSVNLAALNPFLPKTGESNVSGDMSFDLAIKGPIKDLGNMTLNGSLSVKNAAYSAKTLPEPIQSLNLDAGLEAHNLIIKSMSVKFPSSDFVLTGTMTNAFPNLIPKYAKMFSKPYLTFEMKSHRFDTDKLFPEAVPGAGANIAALPTDSLPALILPDIDGKGIGNIDTLIYSKVEFTKITGDITIKDRVIYATNADGNVYTGKVKGEAAVDLNDFNNPKYSGKYDAMQIEANDFLTRFTNFGGHLYGKLNTSGSFTATGWEPPDIMKSLSMDGTALISEAKLVGFDMIENLGDQLNFKTPDEENIRNFASNFKIVDGRVQFDALKFFSNFGDWNIIGSVGFDGSLDYAGEVLLSESVSGDLMSKSGLAAGIAGMMKDEKSGRIKVPFSLKGSYSKPKLSLDFSAKEKIQQTIKSKAQEKIDDALQNLFKKKK